MARCTVTTSLSHGRALPGLKGLGYGEVDPVMIGADIYGWASRAGSLSELDRARLRQAAEELQRSLGAFPTDARPYYERILRIARLALAR